MEAELTKHIREANHKIRIKNCVKRKPKAQNGVIYANGVTYARPSHQTEFNT